MSDHLQQQQPPLLLKSDQYQQQQQHAYEYDNDNEDDSSSSSSSSVDLDGCLEQLDFYLLLLGFNQSSYFRFGISWLTFLVIGVALPVVVLLMITNCLKCDIYQVKGFELVVVSSHASLAASALLCLSHNLRKYGIRKFLFVDQYHGHLQSFSNHYLRKISITEFRDKVTFINGGDFAVSSIAQVVGVILCLNAAAKISHRAQGIASLASRWHALASCGPDDASQMRFSNRNGSFEAANNLLRSVSSASDMEAMNYIPLPTNAQLTSYLASYHRRQAFRK
ncbi:hypothetical protein M8C21_004202 [Ambrosia artemisiifolia]|uniref:Uncharacterized protein n=1 Tax=Ambrosia artemisiifolia TaxID=4212 RepID=A0AAD5GRT4_AMBAR|nr:hypothetical protein M8C21_004202 [Ambrosia artemisiifolia]